MIHNMRMAKEVMGLIDSFGIKTKLIGSVKNKGTSHHDIDLVVLNMDYVGSDLISKLEKAICVVKFIATDNGGLFVKTAKYGNLDFSRTHS